MTIKVPFETYCKETKVYISALNENSPDKEIYETYFRTVLENHDNLKEQCAETNDNYKVNTAILEKLFSRGYSFRKICEIMKYANTDFTEDRISETIECIKQKPTIKIAFDEILTEINQSRFHTKYEQLLKEIYENELDSFTDQQELYFLYYELDYKIAHELVMNGMTKEKVIETLVNESIILKNKVYATFIATTIVEPINLSPVISNYSALYNNGITQESVYQAIKQLYDSLYGKLPTNVTVKDYQKFIILYEQIKYKILRTNISESIERDLTSFPELETIKATLYDHLAYEDRLICEHIHEIRISPPISTLREESSNAEIYTAYAQKTQKYNKYGIAVPWNNKIRNDEILLYLYKDGYNADKIAEIFEESTLMIIPTAAEIEQNIPSLLSDMIVRDDIELQKLQQEGTDELSISLYQKMRLNKISRPGENVDPAIALEYFIRKNNYPNYSLKVESVISLEDLLLESPHMFMLKQSEKIKKIKELIASIKESEAYKTTMDIRIGKIANIEEIFNVYAGILVGFGQNLRQKYDQSEIIKLATYMIYDNHNSHTILQTLPLTGLNQGAVEDYLTDAYNYVQKIELAKFYQKESSFDSVNKDIYFLGVNNFFEYNKEASILEIIQANNNLNDQIVKWLDDEKYEGKKIKLILQESPLKPKIQTNLAVSELINVFNEHTKKTNELVTIKNQQFIQEANNEIPTRDSFSSLKEYRNFVKDKQAHIQRSIEKAQKNDSEYIRYTREKAICDKLSSKLQNTNVTHIKGEYSINNITTFCLLYAETFDELIPQSHHQSVLNNSQEERMIEPNPIQASQEKTPEIVSDEVTAVIVEVENTLTKDVPTDIEIDEVIEKLEELQKLDQEETEELQEEISKPAEPEKKQVNINEDNPLLKAISEHQIKNDIPEDQLKTSEKFMNIAKKLLDNNNGRWDRNLDIRAVQNLIKNLRVNSILVQKVVAELTPSTYQLNRASALEYMAAVIEEAKKPSISVTSKQPIEASVQVPQIRQEKTPGPIPVEATETKTEKVETDNDKTSAPAKKLPNEEKFKNFNLKQIKEFTKQDDDDLDPDEKYFSYAHEFYVKNNAWDDDYDKKIAKKMLLTGFTEEAIKTIILLNSPSLANSPLETRTERMNQIMSELVSHTAAIAATKDIEQKKDKDTDIDTETDEEEIIEEEPYSEGIEKVLAFALPEKEFSELTDPQKYMYLAKEFLKKNHNHWAKDFDHEIAKDLHKKGISLPFIDRMLHNYSPVIYGKSLLLKESYVKSIISSI